MFNPTHPGDILKEDVIDALGLSVTDAARKLRVSRETLSRVLNERAGVGTARFWMALQAKYDLCKPSTASSPPSSACANRLEWHVDA